MDFTSKHKYFESFPVLEVLQKRNYDELARYSRWVYSKEEYNLVVTKRNRNWLFINALPTSVNRVGLAKRLKETKEPLAIIFGAGQLPDEDSLVSILSQQDFIAERDPS